MCGITGFVGRGSQQDLGRMTHFMAHRGPDGHGFWTDPQKGVYLGHRRLSIIDIEGGRQPMQTNDGQWTITFNGEIYNHLQLRKELEEKGYHFQSDHSDTEVLLHGYCQWGEDIAHRLNGMWAFAIYDRPKNQIFISRDRFGKKPLFYTFQNDTFAFASELTALIRHSNLQSSLSELSLKKYFAFGYIPCPNSIFKQIYKLPAGHNLCFDINRKHIMVKKYWEFKLEPFEKIPARPEEEWGGIIRDLLSKAVKRRLMADVPLGVFLSGGIDSSSVSAYAKQACPEQSIRTFSIGFEEESFDESHYAKRVADLLKTDHYMEVLSIEKARTMLQQLAVRLDEPMGDSSFLPTFLLSRITRKKVTVALGGDGADELFAGYDPFRAVKMANFYNTLIPKPIHKGIRMLMARLPVSHQNMSFDFKIKRTLRGLSYPPVLWNPIWLGPLGPAELKELFFSPFDLEEVYSEAIEKWENCRGSNLIDQTLAFYTWFYLQDDILVKVDRASMLNSLEVRAPYLDIDLVDFIRKIPHDYKYRNGQTKYILKKALASVLPPDILYRSKKGFGIPIGPWFSQNQIKSPKSECFNMLNNRFILAKQTSHQACKEDNRAFLWNIWLLRSWWQGR